MKLFLPPMPARDRVAAPFRIDPAPKATVRSVLEEEIPARQISQHLQEMMRATRQTSSGSMERDWATVEAGLRLYLEWTCHATGPGAGHAFSRPPVEPDLQHRSSKPGAQKYPLSQHLETKDGLMNFMTYGTPLEAFDNAAASHCRQPWSEYGVPWVREQPPASLLPQPTPPETPRNRWPLLLLSALAMVGPVSGVCLLSPRRSTSHRQDHAPIRLVDAGAMKSASREETSPSKTAETSAQPADPPAGWANREAYEAWNPKFDTSLSPE